MGTLSAGLTDEIHSEIKRIKNANDITIGGFVNIALSEILLSDAKIEKVLKIIQDNQWENHGAGRLNNFKLL